MPEDKPYIKKVFNFMQSAFGANGQLSAGAFTNDFDTFYNKITTNPKYADKVHLALDNAYGTRGKVKKGAFTSTPAAFKSKVLAPAAMQPGEQFPIAAQLTDLNRIGTVPEAAPNPNEALLQSAQEIPEPMYKGADGLLTTTKPVKPLEDISAIDEMARQKAESDKAVGEAFAKQVFNTDPEVDIMTGKELPLSDFKLNVRDFKDQMEAFDKNLQEQQRAADEFYQTTGGKIYYNVLRPVYQTFLNVGKNVGAATFRMAGDIGGGLGLDDSQRILNKTADGIVDYFDFGRLAKEGNPTVFLNITPTELQGKFSSKNLLPKAVEAISSMASVMGGARVLGGNAPALFTSSFMSTYEYYRQSAKENGLTNSEADRFAITSAGLTSVLEMISPNRFLLRPGELTSASKGVFKAIKDGVPVTAAVKSAAKQTLKEIGNENIQEFSQAIGDKVVRAGTDLMTGKNRFNESSPLPTFDESLELAVLTSIATGVMSGRRFARNVSPSNVERSAWAQAAEQPQIIEQGIARGLEDGTITEQQAAKMQQDVSDYKQIYDALNEQLSETNPNADISRIAFDAFQSQRLKQQQQPLQGIPALTAVQQQNDQQNAELESNIQDELSGIPEVGTEVSSSQVKEIMTQTGAENKVDQVSDNDYKTNIINLTELYNNNQQFKEYVDNGQLRESKNKDGLRTPVIINNDGKIVDGLNRLAQQYVNGNNTARAFVETNNITEQEDPALAVENNIQPAVEPSGTPTIESTTVEADNQEAAPEVDTSTPKQRRDEAITRLKDAWSAYGRSGIISDPEQNLERDKNFYSALANYVKEELLYRVNQVKGFTGKKKSEMKRDIIKALKAKGISVDNTEALNEAFDRAYEDARNIPGMLEERGDRNAYTKNFRNLIKAKQQARLQGIEEGVEQGKSEIQLKVGAVRVAIQDALRENRVQLTLPQAKSLLAELHRASLEKDVSKAIDVAIKNTANIVWQAKNRKKIDRANRLIKNIQKLKKNAAIVQEDREWINSQDFPNPRKVNDIDKYNDFLEEFIQARRGNTSVSGKTKSQFSRHIEREKNYIYNEQRDKWDREMKRLKNKGVLPANMTLDEYVETLNNTATPSQNTTQLEEKKDKADILRTELEPKMESFRKKDGAFRLPLLLASEEAKPVLAQLSEVELDKLGLKDLLLLNNVLNNISEDGRPDGAGAVITSYQAQRDLDRLEKEGIKIRELPSQKVINKKNISNIFTSLFYNDNVISSFREKVLGGIENKVSKVKGQAQNVVKEFVDLATNNKIGALENARLHAISYLNQYKGNEESDIANSLQQKLEELIDDASYLYDKGTRIEGKKGQPLRNDAAQRLAALKSLGLIEYTITNGKLDVQIDPELLKGNKLETKLNEGLKNLKPGERAVYDYVINKYAELSDKLEFTTRTYANKEFKRERNYVSQVARRKDGAPENNPEFSEETDLTYNQRGVNSKPAGTTITRADKKADNIYYDGDFFSNFVNRYYQSLYTAEVLPELQKSAKLVNDDKFRQFITGQLDKGFKGDGDNNYLKFKNKFIQVVNDEKYAPFFKRGKTNVADAMISRGVRLVLGNVWQAPKQYAPAVVHNFTINNPNAVRYAMQMKGRAVIDAEFRKDRAEFLKNFTGVQRSALGSEAYDRNVKKITENPSWWMKPVETLDKIQKVSSFALERADKAAQNDAYIASYITSLMKQGVIKKPSEFDLSKETKTPNKQALAYAEQMASNINNESAKAYRPDAITQGDYAKYLWLLQGFSLNAYQNAMSKAKIITDNRSTKDERIEAAKHFLGYLGEIGTYQLVGKWARNSQLAIAAALLSNIWGVKDDETEEEKKNKKTKENIRTLASIAGDISMAGLPAPAQAAIKIAANYGYQEWAKIEREEKKNAAKKQGKKYNPKGTHLSPMYVPFYGADGPGGAADFYTAIGKKAIDQVVKAYKEDGKSDGDTANEQLATNLNRYLGIPAATLGLGDLVILNTRMQQVIKNAGKESPKAAAVSSRRRSRSRSRNTNRRRR